MPAPKFPQNDINIREIFKNEIDELRISILTTFYLRDILQVTM